MLEEWKNCSLSVLGYSHCHNHFMLGPYPINPPSFVKIGLQVRFLSRVSILLLTRNIDIVILSVRPSVRPSVRDTLVLYENGLTYRHSFSTVR